MRSRWFILMLFCILSANLCAESKDYTQCSLLNVRIKNETGNDCVIKKYYLPFGQFAKKSQMPEVIFRNREASFSLSQSFNDELSDFLQTSLFIFIECGEGNEVVIYNNTPFLRNSSVQEKKNINAKGTYQDCENTMGKARPWEITWVLEPLQEEIQA